MRAISVARLAIAAALPLGGCASELGPSQAELRARWEAQNVFPQNYKTDLLAFLRTYLNNPEGVRAAVVSPPVLKHLGPGDRYVVCVRYNARDMVGKYTGLKEGAAVYVSAKLERYIDSPREAKELCKDESYVPFPELETLRR